MFCHPKAYPFNEFVFWLIILTLYLFQMILKFFDIFLKMKDLTSSEAFLVIWHINSHFLQYLNFWNVCLKKIWIVFQLTFIWWLRFIPTLRVSTKVETGQWTSFTMCVPHWLILLLKRLFIILVKNWNYSLQGFC